MGFLKKQGRGGKFASVMKGKLVIKCEEDDEGAVSRINKNKDEVWEQHEDGFEGHITSVKIHPTNNKKLFRDQLNIGVKDKESGTYLTLCVDVGSKYFATFCQVMKNLDLRKPVAFEPYDYIKKKNNPENKRTTGWGITQNGEQIEFAFERDEVPKWKKIEDPDDEDKFTWSTTKQDQFFLKHLNKWIEENFSKEDEDDSSDDDDDDPPPAKKSKKKAPVEDEDDDDDDDDDPPPTKKKKKKAPVDDDDVAF